MFILRFKIDKSIGRAGMSELAVDMTERLLPTERAAPSGAWASASNVSTAVVMPPASAGDGRTRSLQLAAWLVSLSSFMWGFGAGVLNVCIVPGAIGSLLTDFNLTTAEQETATALVVVGAMVSAVSTGGVGDRIGLKRTILLNNAFFVAGGVVCALATTKRSIFIGRFLIG
jgi:MFS family permease